MASDRSACRIFGEGKFRLALESNEPHVNINVSLAYILFALIFTTCTVPIYIPRIG